MQLLTFTLGAAGLPALVSSFVPGPVAISPRFAFVSQHPYRNAVDGSYPLRTPIGVSPKPLVQESDDVLLTPETYADSQSAENQVEHIIMDAAVEAFKSTDFTTEPHLPPELENCEIAYKDDGEDESTSSPTAPQKESFQRSLLAQQLAYNAKKAAPVVSEAAQEASKKQEQEAFQRSLLAARLSNGNAEPKSEEDFLQKDSQVNWMESEVRAASLGGKESVPFYDSAAMATSSAAEATDAAKKAAPTSTTSDELAAAKNKIGVTPLVASKVVKTSGRKSSKQPDNIAIQSYVTQKGVELTKERMRQKLGVGSPNKSETPSKSKVFVGKKQSAGTEDSVTNYLSTGVEKNVGEKKSVAQTKLQKFLQKKFVQRLRQPKILIISVLFAVLCRSLALAWFGNPVMRLK